MKKEPMFKNPEVKVFDDKSTGLRCLTLIIIVMTVAVMFVFWMAPNGNTSSIVLAAMLQIITGAVGGIVGMVTGSRRVVRSSKQQVGNVSTTDIESIPLGKA